MISKIISFVSLIVSIAAFVISGAFLVYRIDEKLTIAPVIILMCATFPMVIICAFNYYHTIVSPDEEENTDTQDVTKTDNG